jgi:hypothetical protein
VIGLAEWSVPWRRISIVFRSPFLDALVNISPAVISACKDFSESTNKKTINFMRLIPPFRQPQLSAAEPDIDHASEFLPNPSLLHHGPMMGIQRS